MPAGAGGLGSHASAAHSTPGQKEMFGPIACPMPFTTEEEALAVANDTPYGLTAASSLRTKPALGGLPPNSKSVSSSSMTIIDGGEA